MKYVVITTIGSERTKAYIEAPSLIAAENEVKNPALQNGEQIVDVIYGDTTGTSIIKTSFQDKNIERQIFLSRFQS